MSTVQNPKEKRSFKVPQSLPEGVHRRKLEKIRNTLSHNAGIKKSYRKTLKQMGLEPISNTHGQIKLSEHENNQESNSLERTERRPKVSKFNREQHVAKEVQESREQAQKERTRREHERKLKIEERIRNRKKMTQYTRHGQPKLGKRVELLLDKIKNQ
ncbi:hypothetical protein V1514DRAFT_293713 [Lipomyces japonicus]|uniref:uncharacterized protein n=1 Tax=Lipomyces japonicus TaxID=56871 RepID=UPI0034CDB98C